MNFLGYAGYRIKMNPIDILDFKRFKGAVFFIWFTFTLCAPDVKFMGN